MSKQQEAKTQQGYTTCIHTCENCGKFSSLHDRIKTPYGDYDREYSLRCSVGGFKVNKRGTCSIWTPKSS